MVLNNIEIFQFRNYDHLELKLKEGINIIYGNNAQGKTNLLESIYVLGLTKSHRSFIDNSLIKDGMKVAKIKGSLKINTLPIKLEIIINNKNKKLKIDENDIKKVSDYISNMNIIIFYPEDLELIKGSPSIRRRFLNLEISQLNSTYLNIYNEYSKIIKIRNEYLKKINKGINIDENYFNILNQYLIDKAIYIYRERNKLLKMLNKYSKEIFKNLSGIDNFNIKYKTSVELDNKNDLELKKIFEEKLQKLRPTEIKLGVTLLGPHRDDFEFYIGNNNLKNYGSQGQQRMAVLSIKLSEINIFKSTKNTNPILLLDDVFSELDDNKKNNLLSYISEDIQTIITTTDLKNIDKSILKNAKLIKIDNGQIMSIQEEE